MRPSTIGIGLALLLAGCGDGETEAVTATNAAANAAETANRIAALPDGQRNAVFIRAIRDAGQDCQHVDGSEPAGEYQGYPVWRAHCDGGLSSWTIVITADGTAQIINDAEARLAGVNMTEPAGNAADANAATAAGNAQ